jgi:hypothetical protein
MTDLKLYYTRGTDYEGDYSIELVMAESGEEAIDLVIEYQCSEEYEREGPITEEWIEEAEDCDLMGMAEHEIVAYHIPIRDEKGLIPFGFCTARDPVDVRAALERLMAAEQAEKESGE